jgi:hypothetical protein
MNQSKNYPGTHYCSQHKLFARTLDALEKNFEKRLLAYSCLSALPKVLVEQLVSQWKDFGEILYLRILRKSVEEFSSFFQNLRRITGTLHGDLCTFKIINFSARSYGENKKMCLVLVFSENCAFF